MFTYYMPTKIIAGEYAVKQNPSDLILGTKAMIVTGRHSGAKSGALQDVTDVLQAHQIPYLVYDKIENNPTIESTVEGGRIAREYGADFLIGIGGGSPLDACKAIAVYAVNTPEAGSGFDVHDIFACKYTNKPLPMAAVPTTAGTGSEVTQYAVLTLHDEQNKKSFASPDVFFQTAFLDGRYTVNLPVQVARNTAIDAISHLVESYTVTGASPATEYMALEGLRMIGLHLDALQSGQFNTDICTELLWAATLGGCVIAQTGTTIVHSMGYPLTYYKGIPHGMANGLLLAQYMRQVETILPDKIENCLKALRMESVDALEERLKTLLPCDETFTAEELHQWSMVSVHAKNAKVCPFPVTQELEETLYRNALL